MRLLALLRHWFVPHEGNNHRAKALHHEALLSYVLLLAVFNLGVRFFHGAAPDVLGYATDIRVEQLLASTNAKRAEAGLSALSLNGSLSQAAAAKATDMFTNNYWAHNSPAGKTPWDFIIGAGYRYALAGENLAKNFQTSDGVVDAWMNSPTHKANIVKDGYKEVGFAVVNGVLNGEETTLVVQMFGSTTTPLAQVPKAQAAEPQSTPKPQATPLPTVSVQPMVAIVPTEAIQQQVAVPTEAAPQASAPANASVPPTFIGGLTFERVIATPKINMESMTSNLAFITIGLLVGLLSVDAFVVSRKHVVRVSGHNVAHILFLGTMVISGLTLTRGSLI